MFIIKKNKSDKISWHQLILLILFSITTLLWIFGTNISLTIVQKELTGKTTVPQKQLVLTTPKNNVHAVRLVMVGCGDQIEEFRNSTFSQFLNTLNITIDMIECDPKLKDVDSKDESTYYLKWFYEHYDTIDDLNDIILFAHPHQTSYHYQGLPLSLKIKELLQSKPWQSTNYGHLYNQIGHEPPPFGWWAGKHFMAQQHMSYSNLWQELFANTSMEDSWTKVVTKDNKIVYQRYPCCGTFWMKKELILSRSKDDYRIMRDNIFAFNKKYPFSHKNRITGRVFEGAWHVMFLNESSIY